MNSVELVCGTVCFAALLGFMCFMMWLNRKGE